MDGTSAVVDDEDSGSVATATRPDDRTVQNPATALVGSDPLPGRRVRDARSATTLVALLVGIGIVVALVGSLGSALIPLISQEYGRSVAGTQWVLTATLLVGAISTPVLGRLAGGPHRRVIILGGLALIAIGAGLCTVGGAYLSIVIGRALQGVGIGLMPVAIAVAHDHLPTERVASSVALLSVTTALGVGVGYPIIGFVASRFGLRPTFAIVTLAAVAVLLIAHRTIPSNIGAAKSRLDIVGAGLLAAALVAIILGLSHVPTWGFDGREFWLCLAIASVSGLGWVWRELRVSRPLVGIRSLGHPQVAVAHLAALLGGLGMFLLFGALVSYVQMPTSTGYGMGHSALVAGVLLVPFSLMSYAASRQLPLLDRLVGARWTMPVGCIFYLASTAVFAIARSSIGALVIVSACAGFGVGVVLASLPRMLVDNVGSSEVGSALGFSQVLRTAGGAFGSAIFAVLLAIHTPSGALAPEEPGFVVVALASGVVWVLLLVVTVPWGTWRGAVRRGVVHSGGDRVPLPVDAPRLP